MNNLDNIVDMIEKHRELISEIIITLNEDASHNIIIIMENGGKR